MNLVHEKQPSEPRSANIDPAPIIDGFVDLPSHAEYTIAVSEGDKVVSRVRHRYSDFLPLHDAIAGPLGLKPRFPVPKAFFNSRTSFKLALAKAVERLCAPRPAS